MLTQAAREVTAPPELPSPETRQQQIAKCLELLKTTTYGQYPAWIEEGNDWRVQGANFVKTGPAYVMWTDTASVLAEVLKTADIRAERMGLESPKFDTIFAPGQDDFRGWDTQNPVTVSIPKWLSLDSQFMEALSAKSVKARFTDLEWTMNWATEGDKTGWKEREVCREGGYREKVLEITGPAHVMKGYEAILNILADAAGGRGKITVTQSGSEAKLSLPEGLASHRGFTDLVSENHYQFVNVRCDSAVYQSACARPAEGVADRGAERLLRPAA